MLPRQGLLEHLVLVSSLLTPSHSSGLWVPHLYLQWCGAQEQPRRLYLVAHIPLGDPNSHWFLPIQPSKLHNYPHFSHAAIAPLLGEDPWVTSGKSLQLLGSSPGLSGATQRIPDAHVRSRFCVSSQVGCLMGFHLKPLLLQRSVLQPPSKGSPRWPLENRVSSLRKPTSQRPGPSLSSLSFRHAFLCIIVIGPTEGHPIIAHLWVLPLTGNKPHQISARRELSVSS